MDGRENGLNGLIVAEKEELPRQPELAGAEDGALAPSNLDVPGEDGILRNPDFGLSEEEKAKIVCLVSRRQLIELTGVGQTARLETRLASDSVG
jgi:hypothetical protein